MNLVATPLWTAVARDINGTVKYYRTLKPGFEIRGMAIDSEIDEAVITFLTTQGNWRKVAMVVGKAAEDGL